MCRRRGGTSSLRGGSRSGSRAASRSAHCWLGEWRTSVTCCCHPPRDPSHRVKVKRRLYDPPLRGPRAGDSRAPGPGRRADGGEGSGWRRRRRRRSRTGRALDGREGAVVGGGAPPIEGQPADKSPWSEKKTTMTDIKAPLKSRSSVESIADRPRSVKTAGGCEAPER